MHNMQPLTHTNNLHIHTCDDGELHQFKPIIKTAQKRKEEVQWKGT